MPDKKNGVLLNSIVASAVGLGLLGLVAWGALSESVTSHEENKSIHAEGVREEMAAARATQNHIQSDISEVKQKVGKIETDVGDIKTSLGVLIEMQRRAAP